MPPGQYTVTLRVTGSFRDDRDAAAKIKSIVEDTVEREQAAELRWLRKNAEGNYTVSEHQIRRVEII